MTQQSHPISGVYEVCIGVDTDHELQQVKSHFQQFGFRPSLQSTIPFDEQTSKTLYGHSSSLHSIRLAHTDSDHGLLRIWKWGKTKDQGAPIGSLKARGRRWAAALTSDIFNIANHARTAQAMDSDVRTLQFDPATGLKKTISQHLYWVEPMEAVIYEPDPAQSKPFKTKIPFVHEALFVSPLFCQIFYQRHDYLVPDYGKINEDAHFPSSQFSHCGLVIVGDDNKYQFYENTLGLKQNAFTKSTFPPVTQAVLDATPEDGDVLYRQDFDDPRSGDQWTEYRSGRLHTMRFDPGTSIPDITAFTNPGSKGMTGYSLRVTNITEYHGKVSASSATDISNIMPNEFGELSFSFYAPDGYWWQIIEWINT